ncbi:hypothetical protein LIER_30751 [Lithospermum erythrorhizon]|uniref:Uncharacterized protein n=1 Tax=Lithospermum erythrorhizon TaxID=34254 RepID=A0AAV3RQM3_LITER
MENMESTLPLFFNLHSTSHSGFLTSFSSLFDYNIFVEDKPDKVSEGRQHSKWCYVLGGMDARVPRVWTPLSKANCPKFAKSAQVKAQIALLQGIFQGPLDYKVFWEEGILVHAGIICSKEFDSSVEPPITWGITFFTSFFAHSLLTKSSVLHYDREARSQRAKVVTKTPESASALAGGLATALGKTPLVPATPSKPVFVKRSKTLDHKPPRKEVLDLTHETLPSTPPHDTIASEVPLADTPLVRASSSKEKESDSAPKVTVGHSANYLGLPYILPGSLEVTGESRLGKALDAFRVTRPLLLEGLEKTYEEYSEPLEI